MTTNTTPTHTVVINNEVYANCYSLPQARLKVEQAKEEFASTTKHLLVVIKDAEGDRVAGTLTHIFPAI